MRYYIISIASIFLSLAIGIFIGFNMNGNDIYVTQQQELINSLERRFDNFKAENDALENKIQNLSHLNEKQNILIENIVEDVVYKKLQGMNVAIIETTDNYFYVDLKDILASSGANIPVTIQYLNKAFRINGEELREINELFGLNLQTTEDMIYFINNEITNFLLKKEITAVFQYLITKEYIHCNLPYENLEGIEIDRIIVAGGSNENVNNKIEKLEVNLIKRLDNLNFKVIGVERLDVENSFIANLKKIKIPTIDNVNTRIGQVSLIYVLLGAEGHYGEKATADSLIPFYSMQQVRGEFVE